MLPPRLLSLFTLLLLALGLVLGGCPAPTDDDDDASGADDDDSTPPTDDDDDDDDTVPTDDDDTVADDDDVTTLDECEGPTIFFAETEPNEGEDKTDFNVIKKADGDVVITGSASVCSNDGNGWTGDEDWFVVAFECGGMATYTLTWTGSTNTDMDFNVFVPAADPDNLLAAGYEFGFDPLETDGPYAAGGEHQIGILCWEGASVNWEFTIDWDSAPGKGDDDDSVSDDDDTAVDDDDTAVDDDDTAVDDDDSATSDDDDTAVDDDDTATDDDDDSAVSDDDDSVSDDDDSAAASPCQQFCGGVQTICTAGNQQWSDAAACEIDCNTWPLGTFGDSTGNSLACRGYHLNAAMTSGQPEVHCPHAGPTGGGVCQ
jgi:hypothetical protein